MGKCLCYYNHFGLENKWLSKNKLKKVEPVSAKRNPDPGFSASGYACAIL